MEVAKWIEICAAVRSRGLNPIASIRDHAFKLCHKVVESNLAIDNMSNRDLLKLGPTLKLLSEHQAGCWCGSAALFFEQTLAALGHRAARIDFGLPGTAATHISVVVDMGGGIWQLHDPYFNVSSEPIDTRESEARLTVHTRELQANDFQQTSLSRALGYQGYSARFLRRFGENYAYAISFTIEDFFSLNPMPHELLGKTGIDTLNLLYSHPFQICDESDFALEVFERLTSK